MEFGLLYVNAAAAGRDDALALARAAEEHGFDSLWTVEHVVVPRGYVSRYPYHPSGKMAGGAEDFDLPDPLVWLGAAAAVTERVRLATGVLVLPQRNPLLLAKEVATLDVLSAGRAVLGVGVGWLEEEFRALGVPFEDRGARTDEYIRLLRLLWTSEDAVSHAGRFASFDEVFSRPLPVQRPVPIVVGGHSPRAARRAGELGDGYFPASASPEELPGLVRTARAAAERTGRDPASLEITMGSRPDAGRIETLAELGIDRVVVPAYLGLEGIAHFAQEVMSAFRST